MFHRRDGPRLVSAIAAQSSSASRDGWRFVFSARSLAAGKQQCTANPTSTIMIGVTMVKASVPGNITTSNASIFQLPMETELSISDGVRIVGAGSQLRAAILWRGFVLGMGKPRPPFFWRHDPLKNPPLAM